MGRPFARGAPDAGGHHDFVAAVRLERFARRERDPAIAQPRQRADGDARAIVGAQRDVWD